MFVDCLLIAVCVAVICFMILAGPLGWFLDRAYDKSLFAALRLLRERDPELNRALGAPRMREKATLRGFLAFVNDVPRHRQCDRELRLAITRFRRAAARRRRHRFLVGLLGWLPF
jgi:hypothetical protein